MVRRFWVTTELLPFVDHFHRVLYSKFLSSNIHEMNTHLFVVNFEFGQKKEHFYVENFTCTCLWFIHIVSFQSCVDISKGLNLNKVVNILKTVMILSALWNFFEFFRYYWRVNKRKILEAKINNIFHMWGLSLSPPIWVHGHLTFLHHKRENRCIHVYIILC